MLTWILMIIILIALVIIFSWLFAKLFGRGEQAMPLNNGEEIIEYNRRVVGAGDIDDIMFETVLRGYRQDQVDDVVAHLKWQVDSLSARLSEKASEQDFSTELPTRSAENG